MLLSRLGPINAVLVLKLVWNGLFDWHLAELGPSVVVLAAILIKHRLLLLLGNLLCRFISIGEDVGLDRFLMSASNTTVTFHIFGLL